MQFTATEEIAAPIETVWAHVTDFEGFAEMIRKRGGKAERQDDTASGPGVAWSGAAEVMGKIRHVDVTVTRMEAPAALDVASKAEGLDIIVAVALESLSPDRTKMTVATATEATSMRAKVLLQPLKLAHGKLQERYCGRVAGFARRIESAAT